MTAQLDTRQFDIVEQVDAVQTADKLIADTIRLKDKLKAAQEQFDRFCKPWKETIADNENKLLALLNEQRLDSVSGDAGTAYKSTITSYKVVDRDKVLDNILHNWEEWGSEMLMFNVQKEAVRRYAEEHKQLPEGITSDSFIRINIRRS